MVFIAGLKVATLTHTQTHETKPVSTSTLKLVVGGPANVCCAGLIMCAGYKASTLFGQFQSADIGSVRRAGREPEMCNGFFRPIPPSESVVSTPPAIVQKQETKNRAGGRAGAMICVECEVQTQYMEHTFDPITTLH